MADLTSEQIIETLTQMRERLQSSLDTYRNVVARNRASVPDHMRDLIEDCEREMAALDAALAALRETPFECQAALA